MSDEDEYVAQPRDVNSQLPFRINLPPPFSGEGPELFHSCIQRFEVALAVSPKQLDEAKLLPAKLSGLAFSYWQTFPPDVKNYYAKVKLLFLIDSPLLPLFRDTSMHARANLMSYAAELTTLVAEEFPTYDTQGKSSEVFRRFGTGLDSSLQLKIHKFGAVTLEAALKVDRGQLALSIASPSPVMPVTVDHVLPSSPASMPIAELTAAICRGIGLHGQNCIHLLIQSPLSYLIYVL